MEEAYYKLLNDILRGYDRCTPTKIVSLRANQIFVFGTDRDGSQKNGAAGMAAKSFGAKVGVTDGPTGKCYALPTFGFSEKDLAKAAERFEAYVRSNMGYTYLVTAVGCGHAGFNVTHVANMFKGLISLNNVMLPEAFLGVYRKECNAFFAKNRVKTQSDIGTKDEIEEILQYYDDSVHDVVRYLLSNNIQFNHEGGFSLEDENGTVIAEAELGIEKDMVVISPYNKESESAFVGAGYKVMTPSEYLISKK